MFRESLELDLGSMAPYMSTISQPEEETYEDPLDDVFGSDENEGDSARQHNANGVGANSESRAREQSEIPRLRSTHVTNGYRDGVSESKSQFVQQGFDEGYSLGAMLGFKAAWLLSVLPEVILDATTKPKDDAVKELSLQSVFSPNYFNDDGIWNYPVPGQEDELDFDQVSNAHPLIQKWTKTVIGLAESKGLYLEPFSTRYEDGS